MGGTVKVINGGQYAFIRNKGPTIAVHSVIKFLYDLFKSMGSKQTVERARLASARSKHY